jgi:hypothetical protein
VAASARDRPDLIKTEQRGPLAAIGDFVQWLGMLRRLQEFIDQADLEYRAPEVFSLATILFAGAYFLLGLLLPIFALRLLNAALIGATPILYILWKAVALEATRGTVAGLHRPVQPIDESRPQHSCGHRNDRFRSRITSSCFTRMRQEACF